MGLVFSRKLCSMLASRAVHLQGSAPTAAGRCVHSLLSCQFFRLNLAQMMPCDLVSFSTSSHL